jgi:DNA-binding NtrC family response regulator
VITSHYLNLSQHGIPTQIDLATRVRNTEGLDAVLREVERTMIAEALRQSDGNEEDAARRLCLAADELARRLQLAQDVAKESV